MTRLPIPGSDYDTWGGVLVDFLQQSHTATGGLASGAVGSSQLQDNSVTATAITNGAVTADKLASGMRSLLIFYAPPSIINAKYNNDYAAGILARYDDVVMGTGLEDPGSGEYANTTAIITKVAALNPSTVIWGYIDCGVTTGNLSLATLQTQIDQWVAIGAGGIFCDVIGYAYQVSRSRQNSIIDYIHSKGVGAILNVFDADEIFSSDVDATYNAGGVATHADSRDVHLLESWIFNSDAYGSPHYVSFSDVKTRGDLSRAYRVTLGFRIFSVNIIEYDGRTDNQIDAYRGVGEAMAWAFRLDGCGISGSSYASTGDDVGVVRARAPMLRSNPLRPTAPYILNGGWTEISAPDLGIIIDYQTGSHSYTQD